MAEPSNSVAEQFICSCQKDFLSQHQIIDHLNLKGTHNIRKIVPQSSKFLKNSILNKIANITNIQVQIQASSNQLIQTVTQNTSAIIQKLSKIINLYRHLILNPPQVKRIKNKELINTFKLDPTLFTALNQSFAQLPVGEAREIDTIIRNVRTQIIDIRRNHVGGMACMAVFSDEKRVVSGGADGAVRIWDLETKSQIWFIIKHKGPILSLALASKEDLVLTGSIDTSLRLWNVKLKLPIFKFEGHSEPVTSVLFSQDQRTGFSGSADYTIRSWNLKSFTPQRKLHFQNVIISFCLISEEKIIVSCGSNGCVSFFYLKNNKHLNATSDFNSNITCICFSANEDQFITGSEDGTVEVWLTNGLKKHFYQKKHSAQIRSIKISACSKFFATGSEDKTVILWDFSKLHTIRLIQNKSIVNNLYFVKNSRSLIICSTYGINQCYLGTFVNKEKIKVKWLNSIAISSDLKYAAYGGLCVSLISIGNKKKVAKSSNIKENILCLEFSQNSAFIAAGCYEGEITILSIPNLVTLRILYSKLAAICCLSFSRSNELIGFSDGSTSVKVMLIGTRKVIYNEGKRVYSVCFCSNDKKFIYSDLKSIYVIQNFILLNKIGFSFGVKKLFANEDDSYVLVVQNNFRCSIIKVESVEKIFEDESKNLVKEWCTRRQQIKFQTHLSLSIKYAN